MGILAKEYMLELAFQHFNFKEWSRLCKGLF